MDWGGGWGSGVGWGEYRYENLALSLDFNCSRELKHNSKVGYWQGDGRNEEEFCRKGGGGVAGLRSRDQVIHVRVIGNASSENTRV